MEIDASLMEIFLGEVKTYTQVLQDEEASIESQGDAAHGLKGIAAMLGFNALSAEAAKLEQELRGGDSSRLLDRLESLTGYLDTIKESCEEDGSHKGFKETPTPSSEPPENSSKVDGLTASESSPDASSGQAPPKGGEFESDWDDETAAMLLGIFREEAREHLDGMERSLERLKQNLQDKQSVHDLFRFAHTLKGASATVGLDAISKAAHSLESRFEKVRTEDKPLAPRELDICLHATELLNKMVFEGEDPASRANFERELQRVLSSSETASPKTRSSETSNPETLRPSSNQTGPGQPPEPEPLSSFEKPPDSYTPTSNRRQTDRRAAGRRDEDRRIIRIPVERVDALMDSVGELVFARTRIHRRTQELSGLLKDISLSHRGLRNTLVGMGVRSLDHRLIQRFSEIEVEFADEVSNLERAVANLSQESDWLRRISASIQEGLIGLRMMSIRFLMARLKRAAREMARDMGKELVVELEGEDTELDKSVAERLTEPLVHLVRNALGHGIETAEERQAAGKPPEGRLHIAARTEGEDVLIEVKDDGKGIDLRKIRAAVLKRGLMPRSQLQRLTNEQAIELIFLPGFTTQESVDTVSGRGVGLDAVQESISALSGEINITSKKNKGTKFLLRLPLLTTISNALLFKVGGEVYAISLTHVEETLILTEEDLVKVQHHRKTLKIKGREIPLLDLPALLGVERKGRGKTSPAFLGRWGSERFVATCDKIVGPREIVVKPLGGLLAALPHFCGATISGAGKVQLVLDAAALARSSGARRLLERHAVETRYRGPRVLLCDDSRSIREVVSRILLQAGFQVEKAHDGWDAWERMNGTRIDLLLTDLEMPRLDGYALIERVRRDEKFTTLPIIVLTSRTGETNKKRADEAGADRFVTKPVNKRVILKQVKELLKASRSYDRAQN